MRPIIPAAQQHKKGQEPKNLRHREKFQSVPVLLPAVSLLLTGIFFNLENSEVAEHNARRAIHPDRQAVAVTRPSALFADALQAGNQGNVLVKVSWSGGRMTQSDRPPESTDCSRSLPAGPRPSPSPEEHLQASQALQEVTLLLHPTPPRCVPPSQG